MRILNDKGSGKSYIIIVLLWTWGLLLFPIIFGLGFNDPVTKGVYLLAGAAPSVLALFFVFLGRQKDYCVSFLKRIYRFDYIGLKGYLFIFLFVPAVTLCALMAQWLITSVPPDWSALLEHTRDPFVFLVFAVLTLVMGPLAEEIGWRGYLLDRLTENGPWAFGVGLGFIWTIWHLPMFFIDGTYQNGLLERGVIPVVCFFISTMALGVILSGFVLRNNKSILAAILFHFMVNFTGELTVLTEVGELIQTGIYTAVGVIELSILLRLGKEREKAALR